jgi:hypothetical protein
MKNGFDGKAIQDNVVESWNCVDCGRNTSPGVLDGPAARRRLKRYGKYTARIGTDSEVYTLRNAVWKKTRMKPWGGCLCIGCVEKRLGRKLTPKDFDWTHVWNGFPGTRRLLNRRKFTLLEQNANLFYVSGAPAVIGCKPVKVTYEMPWQKDAEMEFTVTMECWHQEIGGDDGGHPQ